MDMSFRRWRGAPSKGKRANLCRYPSGPPGRRPQAAAPKTATFLIQVAYTRFIAPPRDIAWLIRTIPEIIDFKI